MIIQGLFNLTYDLADDVIGWIGGIGKATIGRDADSKVGQSFVVAAKVGNQIGPALPALGNVGGGKTPK